MQSESTTSVKGGQPADTSPFPSADGPSWEATLVEARENWFAATPIVQELGRPSKKAKCSRWRSQQQRAFAAGIIHSMGIYEGLQSHAQEIRAMLVARGLIDESRAVPSSVGTGARPPAEINTDAAAATWLQCNYVTPTRSRPDKVRPAEDAPYKVYLVDDSVSARLDGDGKRDLFALDQLVTWVLLWANREQDNSDDCKMRDIPTRPFGRDSLRNFVKRNLIGCENFCNGCNETRAVNESL